MSSSALDLRDCQLRSHCIIAKSIQQVKGQNISCRDTSKELAIVDLTHNYSLAYLIKLIGAAGEIPLYISRSFILVQGLLDRCAQ